MDREITKTCDYYRCSFLIQRESKKYKLNNDAIGTIAFPLHSTNIIKSVYNIDKYCDDLLSLPLEFYPIAVCLHFDDINDGIGDLYRAKGFEVFTAGNKFDSNFIDNLYGILSKYKYMTSNGVGINLFIAIDLGMPFFIHGDPSTMYNTGD